MSNSAQTENISTERLEWLDSFGQAQNLGLVIFRGQNDIFYKNQTFFEHCAIPSSLAAKDNFILECLKFMGERGDLGNQSVALLQQNFLKALSGQPAGQMTNLAAAATPPNGKTLDIKLLSSPNEMSLITQDITVAERSRHVLDMVSKIDKSGFYQRSLDSGILELRSAYLRTILTDEEYNHVSRIGLWPLIDPDYVEHARLKWKEALANQTLFNETAKLYTAQNGVFWFRFQTQFSYTNSGQVNGYICHFEDVTDELEIEKELRESKQKIESALKSKTGFLARISHEIRTPMNAVIGIADALLHHNKDLEIAPKLELIQSSAGNILNILDDTLDHSKLDSDNFSLDNAENDPREVLTHLAALWQIKAEQNDTKLICQLDPSLPDSFLFDRFRLEQCVNNFLSNAIKFTQGGTVTLMSTKVTNNGQDHLIIAIKDTGIGMSEEQKERIFVPFQQGDQTISSRYGGTGLGMSISMQIIERMEGKITVKSEPGKGSIFAMIIPIKHRSIAGQNTEDLVSSILAEQPVPQSPYGGLTVLVADDNPTNHIVIKSMLGPIVKEIVTAENGREVLDILAVQSIDLIMMDIHMPVMDGLEATMAIRQSAENWSDVTIIAVTADPEYQAQRICINLGMDYALPKPVKLAELLSILDNHLDKHTNAARLEKAG